MGEEINEIETKAELDAEFKNAGDKLVVVDFFADWCGPCKMIAPKLKAMKNDPGFCHVVFLKVNADDAEDLINDYEVKGLPTFVMFKKGKEEGRVVGASEEKIREKIKELA